MPSSDKGPLYPFGAWDVNRDDPWAPGIQGEETPEPILDAGRPVIDIMEGTRQDDRAHSFPAATMTPRASSDERRRPRRRSSPIQGPSAPSPARKRRRKGIAKPSEEVDPVGLQNEASVATPWVQFACDKFANSSWSELLPFDGLAPVTADTDVPQGGICGPQELDRVLVDLLPVLDVLAKVLMRADRDKDSRTSESRMPSTRARPLLRMSLASTVAWPG